MIYHKDTLRAACAAVSTDETHPDLACVYLDGKRAVATDSYILLQLPQGEHIDADFPVIEGFPPSNGKPYVIPANTLLTATKAFPKKSTIPMLNCVQIGSTPDGDDREIYLATTDTETVNRLKVKDSFQFPDFQSIIDNAERETVDGNKVVFALRIDTALKLFKALKLAGVSDIQLEVRGSLKPIVIRATKSNINATAALALLSPIHLAKCEETETKPV